MNQLKSLLIGGSMLLCMMPDPTLQAQQLVSYNPGVADHPFHQTNHSQNLKDLLQEIEEKYDISIAYKSGVVDDRPVRFDLDPDKSVDNNLNLLSEHLNLNFKKIRPGFYVIESTKATSGDRNEQIDQKSQTFTQREVELADITVKGQVSSAVDRQTIPGVNVVLKGTTIGTVTDMNGAYTIDVPEDGVLVFSSIGFISQEVPVNSRSVIDIMLEEDMRNLDEVVVVGYGTQKKSDLTGSVSVVDMDQLKKMPATNFGQQLQGKAAGVTVGTQGAPGSPTMIRIRGIGTVNNNGPLYVIDGVSTRNQNLNSINPNDIESVQVLKDASSASIYGAQASNGVIIITTKKGKEGKPRVSYDAFYSISQPTTFYDMLDSRQRIDLMWRAKRNAAEIRGTQALPSHPQFGSGDTPTFPRYIIPQASNGPFDVNDWSESNRITEFSEGTDWYEEMTGTAPTQSHQITVSGANNSANYLFGLNYLDQEGIFNETYYKRYSARINTGINITDKIRVGENLTINFSNNNNFLDQSESNVVSWAYRMNPWIPVYDIAGNFAGTKANGSGNAQNPVAILHRNKDNYNNDLRILGNFFVEADLLEELQFRTSFGIDNTRNIYYRMRKLDPEFSESQGRNQLTEGNSFNMRYVWSNTLEYAKAWDKHDLKVLLGSEFIHDGIGRSSSAFRYDYLFEDNINTWTLGNGATRDLNNNSSWNGEMTLFGLFGRADYAFNNKYLVTAIVRRDGSSRFSESNRYGTFPSLSLGWRLTEEEFMSNLSWIYDWKFRVGYGVTGNSEIPRSSNWADEYVTNPATTNYDLDGAQGTANAGFGVSRFGNSDTKWETTKMLNVGTDITLLDGLLEANIEYYVKNTSDMLVLDNYSALAGNGTPPYVNLGSMQNKGWDFTLSHSNTIGKFGYDFGINVSTYKNNVVSLNNLPGTRFWGGGTRYGNVTMTEQGKPISQFFGYNIIGFYESEDQVTGYVGATGDREGMPVLPIGVGSDENLIPREWVGKYIFEDTNGDGYINAEDKTVIGNPHPDFTGGINIGLSYGNFDLSAIFYGSYGNDIYNQVKWWTDFNSQEGNRSMTMLTGSWEPGKTDAVLPILDEGDNVSNRDAHSYYVEDGSYLRLQVLGLGYSLPGSVLGKIKAQAARIYLQSNNLLTLTNYSGLDPEITNSSLGDGGDLTKGIDFGRWPQSRQIQLGLNITF